MLGKREPDAGEAKWGANLSIGYYDQRLGDFDPENTVAEEVRGDHDINDKELRGVLALMLFTYENVDKKMSLLSGGERARVAMAQLLIEKPNVLILDEPTNHLDILSCECPLERGAGRFPRDNRLRENQPRPIFSGQGGQSPRSTSSRRASGCSTATTPRGCKARRKNRR